MKNFYIKKNIYKKTDTQPDYRISARDNDTFYEIGACWKKTDKTGNVFISCKLSDPYNDNKGFHLTEDQLNANGTMKLDPIPEAQNGDISDF